MGGEVTSRPEIWMWLKHLVHFTRHFWIGFHNSQWQFVDVLRKLLYVYTQGAQVSGRTVDLSRC